MGSILFPTLLLAADFTGRVVGISGSSCEAYGLFAALHSSYAYRYTAVVYFVVLFHIPVLPPYGVQALQCACRRAIALFEQSEPSIALDSHVQPCTIGYASFYSRVSSVKPRTIYPCRYITAVSRIASHHCYT